MTRKINSYKQKTKTTENICASQTDSSIIHGIKRLLTIQNIIKQPHTQRRTRDNRNSVSIPI